MRKHRTVKKEPAQWVLAICEIDRVKKNSEKRLYRRLAAFRKKIESKSTNNANNINRTKAYIH